MMTGDQGASRRKFLKLSTVGLAGAALLTGCSRRHESRETPDAGTEPVRRTLGRTGLRLPVVSMGSCYAINLVQAALDEGIVYIHTSSSYSERNHERLLGEAFQDRPRDSFVIATAPDLPYRYERGRGRSHDLGTGVDPGQIAKSMVGSLERLKLDHVDIYYLASIGSREVALHEPYLAAFEQLKQDGKTRFIGLATHENEPEVIRAAAESGVWDVVLTAYNFRQAHREQIRSAISEAAAAGLGVVAMKTQAGVYWDRLRTRMINMKAALKWVLADENIHTTIPAFATFDEMEEALAVMRDPTLSKQEWRDLRLDEPTKVAGLYCQQCKRCLPQCPHEIDLPRLMRGYMYACGHQQPGKARTLLRDLSVADLPCRRCEPCAVRCTSGFDLRSRALELADLMIPPGVGPV